MENFGILFRLDWNSNGWINEPTSEDLSESKFSYVHNSRKSYTYYNFNTKELLFNNKKYALAPQITTKTPIKNSHICFFIGQNSGKDFLVGFILFPNFKSRRSFEHFPDDIIFNVSSNPEYYYKIDPIEIETKQFIPKNKEVGKQGFNYLSKANSIDLLKKSGQNSFPKDFLSLLR